MQVLYKELADWGTVYLQGVHRILERERDVEDAFATAERDGFTRIIFYVPETADLGELADLKRIIMDHLLEVSHA
jgi:hypothetical protein